MRNTLSKSDPYLIQRIVGYLEYGRALNYLDRLVAECDPYELEAVDAIIKAEPEFAIYLLTPQQGVADPDAPDARAKDEMSPGQTDGKRHGLRWITALARVELGAMYAGFSESPRPFLHARSPGYDAMEFKTLLAESARFHFWSLTRDPMFAALRKQFRPTSVTLAYLRRLNIATAFSLMSVQTSNRAEQPRAMEMASYARQLDATRDRMRLLITAYLAEQQAIWSNRKTTQSTSQALTELCQRSCRTFDDPN